MKRTIIIIVFIVLYILVTLFGLGPVLLADGTMRERVITLIVVIAIYSVVTWGFRKALKWSKKAS
ncbi:MAG TPA: hypothetical protein GXZ32_06840 [Clostridiales bacterium]|nr:hypothetical protein [Clostridiales bacterium]